MLAAVIEERHLSFCIWRSLTYEDMDKGESEFATALSLMLAQLAVTLYGRRWTFLVHKQVPAHCSSNMHAHSQILSRFIVAKSGTTMHSQNGGKCSSVSSVTVLSFLGTAV